MSVFLARHSVVVVDICSCREAAKKAPPLMARPLRPYPHPLTLMAIGTFFLVFYLEIFGRTFLQNPILMWLICKLRIGPYPSYKKIQKVWIRLHILQGAFISWHVTLIFIILIIVTSTVINVYIVIHNLWLLLYSL